MVMRYKGIVILEDSDLIGSWSHQNIRFYTKCMMFRDHIEWHELFSKVMLW